MCVVEQKRYVYSDGQQAVYETLRPCRDSDGRSPCAMYTVQDATEHRIREVRPSTSPLRESPTRRSGSQGRHESGCESVSPRRKEKYRKYFSFGGAEVVLRLNTSTQGRPRRRRSPGPENYVSDTSNRWERHRRSYSFPQGLETLPALQDHGTASYPYPPPPPNAPTTAPTSDRRPHTADPAGTNPQATRPRRRRQPVIINEPRVTSVHSDSSSTSSTSSAPSIQPPEISTSTTVPAVPRQAEPSSAFRNSNATDNEVFARAAARERARAEAATFYRTRQREEDDERLARTELERLSFRDAQRQQRRSERNRRERLLSEAGRWRDRAWKRVRWRNSCETKASSSTSCSSCPSEGSLTIQAPSSAGAADLAATEEQMRHERAEAERRELAETLERAEALRSLRQSRRDEDVRAAEERVRYLQSRVRHAESRGWRPRSAGRIAATAHRPDEYLELPPLRYRPVSIFQSDRLDRVETLRDRGARVIADEIGRARPWDDEGVAVLPAGGLRRSGTTGGRIGGPGNSFYVDRRRWRFSS